MLWCRKYLSETANGKWDEVVPVRAEAQQNKVPLLAGVNLVLEQGSIRRLFEQLVRIAHRSRTAKMATLESALHAELNMLSLFQASLRQDTDRLTEIASVIGADPEALQAIAALLPIPFLQACNHVWTPSIAKSWVEGYCSVCRCLAGVYPKCEASKRQPLFSLRGAVAESGNRTVCFAPTAA